MRHIRVYLQPSATDDEIDTLMWKIAKEPFTGAVYVVNETPPNIASTPTGGSDTVTGLLSQPENIPSNQLVSVPPTSGNASR